MKKFGKRQTGFTIVEVMVAVALLAVLAGGAIYFIDFGSKKEQIETVALQNWISQNMQRALLSRFITNGNSLSSTTDALLEATGDVDDKAPGDLVWNVQGTPTDNTITIRIVTASNTAATALRGRISSLAGQGVVETITASSANVDISYKL